MRTVVLHYTPLGTFHKRHVPWYMTLTLIDMPVHLKLIVALFIIKQQLKMKD